LYLKFLLTCLWRIQPACLFGKKLLLSGLLFRW
jgi:hypothetical protein